MENVLLKIETYNNEFIDIGDYNFLQFSFLRDCFLSKHVKNVIVSQKKPSERAKLTGVIAKWKSK